MNPWIFNPPVLPATNFLLFTNNGNIFSFDITYSYIQGQDSSRLTMIADGVAHLSGFQDTPGYVSLDGNHDAVIGIGAQFGQVGTASLQFFEITVLPQTNTLSVQILSPTNSQLFVLSPTNILLTAQVTNSVGSIVTNASVTFASQFGTLGTATLTTNFTYQLLWTDVTNGIYTITAVATASGQGAATNSVGITVNTMPIVSIITPTNVQSYLEVTNVTLTARAFDAEDGTNVTVGFYFTNSLIGWATNIPGTNLFSVTWNSRRAGNYPIVAVATDTKGASTASAIGMFKVNPTNLPPAVVITSPTNGQIFADGSDITITATAAGTDGVNVTNVEFFVDGQDIGGDQSTNNPYGITQCCWKPGTYQLMDGAPDAYDVIATCDISIYSDEQVFQGSDGLSQCIGMTRWRVGYPSPQSVPKVTITSPISPAIYTNPASILLCGSVSGYTNINTADFYTNGIEVGTQICSPGATTNISVFTNEWDKPSPGVYLIKAVAEDESQLVGDSQPLVINIKATNNPIAAIDDVYTIPENSLTVNFDVLTNDISTNALRISQITQVNRNFGTASIGYLGGYIIYAPLPNIYGTDVFYYTVTNSSGALDVASVTVNILVPPSVSITNPLDGDIFNASASILVNASSIGTSATVTNLTVYVNGGFVIQQDTNNLGFNWDTNQPAFYTFTATATDSHGFSGSSTPVTISITNNSTATNVLIAYIGNLPMSTSVLGTTQYTIVQDGLFDLQGQARDSNVGDPVAYQVLLHPPGDEDTVIANVMPLPRDANGFHQGGDVGGDLGTNDFTGVPNGIYDLELIVHGGGGQTSTVATFQLQSQLKDRPVRLQRTRLGHSRERYPASPSVAIYNSLNPLTSDFGYSWTFALNDMDVSLDETRTDVTIGSDTAPFADEGESDNGLPKVVSIRAGGGWDVTLTLPDGRRVTYPFDPKPNGTGEMMATWDTPPGVTATLSPLNPQSAVIYEIPFFYWNGTFTDNGSQAPFDAQDFPGWSLKTLDGTRYTISRGNGNQVIYQDPDNPGTYLSAMAYDPPKLTKIIQRNGDTIVISDSNIAHYAGGTNLTSQVTFGRDYAGRIISVRDPNAGTNGFPTVQYVYNQNTGNLIWVEHLVDANVGTYTTNKYFYDNPNFPHYITSIEDARGVPLVRNLYDDSGKLIGIIDADGHTNSVVHDTTDRQEIQYDRSGQPTYYTYDTKGNVIGIMDALGHTNAFAYDGNGYLTNSVNALGDVTSYVNDSSGNVLSVTVPHPAGSDPTAYTTAFTYDPSGDQTSVVLPTGGVITNIYDDNGNLTQTKDENGNLISFTTYNNGPGLPDSDGDMFGTNYYGYDASGNMTAFTNSIGGVTTSGYDGNGNLTTMADDSGTSTVGYDAMNRETTADYGHGITISNGYQTYSDWNTVDAPTIGHMERQFDDQGRLGGWVTPNGSNPGFAYDINGRLEYETNSIGAVTRSIYNVVGWLMVKTNLMTGEWSAYGYDDAGRKMSETNAYSQVSSFNYWPSGSLMAMTNALGAYWHYSDAAGACSACGSSGVVTDYLGRVVESVTTPHDLPLQTIRRAYAGATGTDTSGPLIAQPIWLWA